MMKRLMATAVCFAAMGGAAYAGSIRVESDDSQVHVVELKCSGSSAQVEIRGNTTTTYTFHSTQSSCDIVGGSVTFPTSKLQNGQHWKIKDGKAIPN